MPDGGHSASLYDPGPQPGGREPAPGRLGLVQAFLNSFHSLEGDDYGTDVFFDPRSLGKWLSSRGLEVGLTAVSSIEADSAAPCVGDRGKVRKIAS